MKDYIEVYDDDGKMEIMEAVMTFHLNEYQSNYIIYSELDKSHYYLAKYNNNDMSDLDTDFEDKEFEKAANIFNEVINDARG